jgi:hypothetical protein
LLKRVPRIGNGSGLLNLRILGFYQFPCLLVG